MISKEHIEKIYNHDLIYETRVITIIEDDELSANSLEKIIKGLEILEEKDDPIRIILSTPGGEEYLCSGIYDRIRRSPCHITIEVYGQASSAGSIILQAADKRVVSLNSFVMIHMGTWGHEGHPAEVKKWRAYGDRWDSWMVDTYFNRIREKNPKFKKSKLKQMLEHDTILTAQEAVDLGLADKVDG